MLPTSYQVPGALVLLVGGLIACCAGYRLFRLVLAIYGFILGALVASSMVSPASTGAMIVAVIVGGAIGASILSLAYFLGVALLGAALGVLVVHVVWAQSGTGGPYALPVIVAAVIGAIAAVVVQRYVIVVGTAFGGAWTALVAGAVALGGRDVPRASGVPEIWTVSPFDVRGWLALAWFVLGVLGVLAQLRSPRRR